MSILSWNSHWSLAFRLFVISLWGEFMDWTMFALNTIFLSFQFGKTSNLRRNFNDLGRFILTKFLLRWSKSKISLKVRFHLFCFSASCHVGWWPSKQVRISYCFCLWRNYLVNNLFSFCTLLWLFDHMFFDLFLMLIDHHLYFFNIKLFLLFSLLNI